MLSIANFKSLAIILILLIILLGIVLIGTNFTSSPPQTKGPLPAYRSIQPTSYPNLAPPSISPSASIDTTFNSYSPQYLKQQEDVTKQEQQIQNQALIVSKFVDKLPIDGQYIKVTYNIYNNQIYLEYNKNSKNQASKEFAELLKDNQIENVSWLSNLNIIEK